MRGRQQLPATNPDPNFSPEKVYKNILIVCQKKGNFTPEKSKIEYSNCWQKKREYVREFYGI